MSKGLVYILTNPCLDGWVKIGMTQRNDIEKRLQELNTPANIPLSFRCYATYEVENPEQVEKSIHRLIDKIDNTLHAREILDNGKIREREFFKISPETAYGIFKEVASLRNDTKNLKLYTPSKDESEEQELAESRTKRSNNSFKLLGIEIGEDLSFLYDDRIVAKSLKNIIERRNNPKKEMVVDGYSGFLLLDKNQNPKVALHIENEMRWAMKKYNKLHPDTPLPNVTPHVLRHTYCTNMVKMNTPLKVLQCLMGHSSIEVTSDIYTHLASEDVNNVVQQLYKKENKWT